MIDEAHLAAADPSRQHMHQVLHEISRRLDVDVSEIMGPKRTDRVVKARQALMYVLHKEMGISTKKVGRFLERDHSTVIHGWRAHEARLQELERERQKIQSLCQITVAPFA